MSAKLLQKIAKSAQQGRLHQGFYLLESDQEARKSLLLELAALLIIPARDGDEIAQGKAAHTNANFTRALSRVEQGNHPDVLVLAHPEQAIDLEELRKLGQRLAFAPLESPRRVVLFLDSSELSAAHANSLLKVLEEPPAYAHFLFGAADSSDLLPTIRSRLVQLSAGALTNREPSTALAQAFPSATAAEIQAALSWSYGDLSGARQLLTDNEHLKLLERAQKEFFAALLAQNSLPGTAFDFVDLVKTPAERLAIARLWLGLCRDLSVCFNATADDRERKGWGTDYFARSIREIQERIPRIKREALDEFGAWLSDWLERTEANVNPKALLLELLSKLQRAGQESA